jgi:hypothetical protein
MDDVSAGAGCESAKCGRAGKHQVQAQAMKS